MLYGITKRNLISKTFQSKSLTEGEERYGRNDNKSNEMGPTRYGGLYKKADETEL